MLILCRQLDHGESAGRTFTADRLLLATRRTMEVSAAHMILDVNVPISTALSREVDEFTVRYINLMVNRHF